MAILFRRVQKPGYVKTSFIWPICERLKSDNAKSFRIAPIIWSSKRDNTSMFSVQPFFYSSRNNNKKLFYLLWILYRHEKIPNSFNAHSVFYKLFTRDHYSDGDFESRFAYLLFTNLKMDGKREKSLWPFYHMVQESNGDKNKTIFLGFYNYFKQYIPEIKEYYEEERIFWLLRLRSNYDYLKKSGYDKYLKKR